MSTKEKINALTNEGLNKELKYFVLRKFTVEDIENPITLESVKEKYEQSN